MKDTVAIL